MPLASISVPVPEIIQAMLDGITPPDPTYFIYGEGVPSLGNALPSALYLDKLTRDVYVWASGADCNSAFDASLHSGGLSWVKVANLSSVIKPQIGVKVGPSQPKIENLSFIRQDRVTKKYLFRDVCWTITRPSKANSLGVLVDIPDPSPSNPINTGTLPVAWVEHHWFAEIRDTYVSTVRYHNGWVPWYGTYPNRGWWESWSHKGYFVCTAEWDPVNQGTLVTVEMPSNVTSKIRPARGYRWDLESAEVNARNPDDSPATFKNVSTWIRGSVDVIEDWTILPT